MTRDIAASVRNRLLTYARSTKRPFQEVLQYFAMERFLYRLAQSEARDRLILKGGLLLTVWQAPTTRPTVDIDLLGYMENEPAAVLAAICSICRHPVEPDGLIFDADSARSEPINPEAEYAGVRVQFRGSLQTARIHMQIDIGFGDATFPAPEPISYPTLLQFPAPKIRAYQRETSIAEKNFRPWCFAVC